MPLTVSPASGRVTLAMWRLSLVLILFTGVSLAQDRPTFYVKSSSTVSYPDGTRVALQEDKVLVIEDFKCIIDVSPSPKASGYSGPSLTCSAPGVGEVAVVSRCNSLVPGDMNSATLQLHSDRSPDDESYTQVTIGCETTYTRVQKGSSPKRKTSGA